MGGYWVYVLIVALICTFIGKKISTDKGRSADEGALYGFFLGIIGLVIVALLPANEEGISQNRLSDGVNKKCPYCAEIIKAEAIVCRFCGREQPKETFLPISSPIQTGAKNPETIPLKYMVICMVGFGLGATIGQMLAKLIPVDNIETLTLKYVLCTHIGLAVGGGLAIGYINKQKVVPWIFAGLAGGLLSGLILFGLMNKVGRSWGFLVNIIPGLLCAIPLAIAFTIVGKNKRHLLWLILAGTLGFSLRYLSINNLYLNYYYFPDPTALGMIVGICFGLALGLLEYLNLEKNKDQN